MGLRKFNKTYRIEITPLDADSIELSGLSLGIGSHFFKPSRAAQDEIVKESLQPTSDLLQQVGAMVLTRLTDEGRSVTFDERQQEVTINEETGEYKLVDTDQEQQKLVS